MNKTRDNMLKAMYNLLENEPEFYRIHHSIFEKIIYFLLGGK